MAYAGRKSGFPGDDDLRLDLGAVLGYFFINADSIADPEYAGGAGRIQNGL